MKTSKYPLLKILLPFVFGIFLAYYCHFSFRFCPIWFYIASIFWLVSLLLSFVKTYYWQWLKTLVLSFGFIFAGMSATNFRYSSPLSDKERTFVTQNREWVVRVVDFPVRRAKTVKLVVEILRSSHGGALRSKALLYVQQSPQAGSIAYGDVLMVSTILEPAAAPANPDAFDNQTYMHRKGLYYTGFVPSYGWQKLTHKEPNPIKAFAHSIQTKLSNIFASSGMNGREYDIIAAILLGDDDTMEPELKAAYASAGVSHLLCVSGMHVGIIFMIVSFLLKPMDLFKGTRIAKAGLLLLIIWLYAHITGLSPSVMRSATMFTFVTIGGLIQRNTNVFHSLLASLWLLLCTNPLLLFEVGFQLSYLAVFGIVLIQPKIAGLYSCRTKIGNYFWELSSVSVAAQISTFPISVYYFGTFPNYFLLSNLSAMALSFIVIVTGVVLLAFSFVPFLTKLLALVLTWEIKALNGIIGFVEGLPGAVTHNIYYSIIQVLLLYLFIALTYLAIHRRRRRPAWVAYGVFALLAVSFFVRKIGLQKQNEVIVYEIPKVSAIGFCAGQQAVLFSDSIRSEKDKLFQYNIATHARKLHATQQIVPIDTSHYRTNYVLKNGSFILYGAKTYYLLKSKEKVYPTGKLFHIDVLILQHNPVQEPQQVAEVFEFKEVIADQTNTPFYVERWRSWCQEKQIPFN